MKKKINTKKIWISVFLITVIAIIHLTVKNEINKVFEERKIIISEITGIEDKNIRLENKIKFEYGHDYIVERAKRELNMRKLNRNEIIETIKVK